MSKRAAERAGDSAKVKVIQEAYDTIMMGGLRTRMANFGKKEDPPEVLYADRTPLFPWRPRVEVSSADGAIASRGGRREEHAARCVCVPSSQVAAWLGWQQRLSRPLLAGGLWWCWKAIGVCAVLAMTAVCIKAYEGAC